MDRLFLYNRFPVVTRSGSLSTRPLGGTTFLEHIVFILFKIELLIVLLIILIVINLLFLFLSDLDLKFLFAFFLFTAFVPFLQPFYETHEKQFRLIVVHFYSNNFNQHIFYLNRFSFGCYFFNIDFFIEFMVSNCQ